MAASGDVDPVRTDGVVNGGKKEIEGRQESRMGNKKKDEGRQSHYVTGEVIFGADRRHRINTAARRLAGQFWAGDDG